MSYTEREIAKLEQASRQLESNAARQGRSLTNTELHLQQTIQNQIRDLKNTPPRAETHQLSHVLGVNSRGHEGLFASLGEQLRAVAHAGIPGGQTDSRLFEINNAATGLGEDIPSAGTFLLQETFSDQIIGSLFGSDNVPSRCKRIPIGTNSNSLLINAFDETSRATGSRFGGVQSYFIGEGDTITPSKPKFRQMNLKLKKVCALIYTTDELMQDYVALGDLLTSVVTAELNFRLTDAILNGTGDNMPLGILNSGCLVTQALEDGQTLASPLMVENIMNMYSLFQPSEGASPVWLVNRTVLPQLYQLSLNVGVGGVAAFMPANGLSGVPYPSLMGYPILITEQNPMLGTKGDLLLVDLQSYIIAEKSGILGGVQAQMSIHVRFSYDESVFRFILRVDGQPAFAAPILPYKGSLAVSPFVCLATRSA